jgi:hypothetical protein
VGTCRREKKREKKREDRKNLKQDGPTSLS